MMLLGYVVVNNVYSQITSTSLTSFCVFCSIFYCIYFIQFLTFVHKIILQLYNYYKYLNFILSEHIILFTNEIYRFQIIVFILGM